MGVPHGDYVEKNLELIVDICHWINMSYAYDTHTISLHMNAGSTTKHAGKFEKTQYENL